MKLSHIQHILIIFVGSPEQYLTVWPVTVQPLLSEMYTLRYCTYKTGSILVKIGH